MKRGTKLSGFTITGEDTTLPLPPKQVRRVPPPPWGRASRGAGFTLLEVMVAVAILAVSLTAIFASEAGAIRVAHRARSTTTATLLARCKMGEIEEQMLKEGLPAEGAQGEDECCEDGEIEGFECEWHIDRIILPEISTDAEPPLGAEGDAEGEESGPPSVSDMLSGGSMGGADDIIGQFAMQYAYPVLKPAIEEQVRRAVVIVKWREGGREHSFDVKQYLVAEQPPAAPDEPVPEP